MATPMIPKTPTTFPIEIKHPAHITKDTHAHLAGRIKILCDGRDVTNDCIEASESGGFVVVNKRNLAGELCVTYPVKEGVSKATVITELLTGTVHILPLSQSAEGG